MLCGEPFLSSDIYFDSEVQGQLKYIIDLGQVQQAFWEYRNLILPSSDASEPPLATSPGDRVLLKPGKGLSTIKLQGSFIRNKIFLLKFLQEHRNTTTPVNL